MEKKPSGFKQKNSTNAKPPLKQKQCSVPVVCLVQHCAMANPGSSFLSRNKFQISFLRYLPFFKRSSETGAKVYLLLWCLNTLWAQQNMPIQQQMSSQMTFQICHLDMPCGLVGANQQLLSSASGRGDGSSHCSKSYQEWTCCLWQATVERQKPSIGDWWFLCPFSCGSKAVTPKTFSLLLDSKVLERFCRLIFFIISLFFIFFFFKEMSAQTWNGRFTRVLVIALIILERNVSLMESTYEPKLHHLKGHQKCVQERRNMVKP